LHDDQPPHRANDARTTLVDWLLGAGGDTPADVRAGMLHTLHENDHVALLCTVWTLTGAVALWWLAGNAWGGVCVAAELLLFPMRVRGSRAMAAPHDAGQPVRLARVLLTWVALLGALTALCMAQSDLRVLLIGTLLGCGFSGYVSSRWAAFPRLGVAGIAMLNVGMGIGLALSPLPPVAAMALVIPAGAAAFTVLLKLNHDVIRGALNAQAENRRLSMHDPLTGLPNRLMLRERLGGWCRDLDRPRPAGFAVLCLDLDGFKAVNDRYGHGDGDWLLRLVAERLAGTLRQGDTVCRTGGDEFVVLLAGAGLDGAVACAERILKTVGQPFVLDRAASACIGVSVGIALAPGHGATPDALLRAADDALYAVKRGGKSHWVVHGGQDAATDGDAAPGNSPGLDTPVPELLRH